MKSKVLQTNATEPHLAKASLPKEMLALLEQSFQPLSKLSPDLPQRVLNYVLEAGDATVLEELARPIHLAKQLKANLVAGKGFDLSKLGDVGELMNLNSIRHHEDEVHASLHARFLREVDCRDAAFFVRLARVYEACARERRHTFMMESAFGDLAFEWLDVFLWEASNVPPGAADHRSAQSCRAIDTALVEAMLAHAGMPLDSLVRALLLQQASIKRPGGPQSVWWAEGYLKKNVAWLPGLAESFTRHKEPVLESLRNKSRDTRSHAVQVLDKLNVPLAPFAKDLVELATSSSKQLRQSVVFLTKKLGSESLPFLQQKAVSGSKEERLHAIQLLQEIAAAASHEFFQTRLAEERSAEVLALLREATGDRPKEQEPAAALVLPPLPPVPVEAPLGAEARRAFHQCCQAVNEALKKQQTKERITPELESEVLTKLESLVLSPAERKPAQRRERKRLLPIEEYNDRAWRPLKEFLARPEIKPLHLVRLFYLAGEFNPGETEADCYFGYRFNELVSACRGTQRMTLRELAAAMDAIGLDGNMLGLYRLNAPRWLPTPFTWEAEAVWPYFAERLDQIEAALNSTEQFEAKEHHQAALRVLALFPQPPARFARILWEMALGGKVERALAQPCLEGVPDKKEKLLAALTSGKAEVRLAAAEWLGRLHDNSVVEPLLAALKQEKQEAVRDTLMLALEVLGAPLDAFLDRERLLQEAQKALAGGLSKEVKWFPVAQLPVVHWADTGKRVEPEILQGWLCSTCKSKSPEPGTLLRRYCRALRPAERQALGQFVLEAWIAQDLTPIPRAEAEKRAKTHAQFLVQFGSYMGGSSASTPAKTQEQHYSECLPTFLKQPAGSAVASKGVLALAAACVGASAAPTISAYLKEWYGNRAAQCRALLQALAWIEHPTVVQLLFAVARRFRTRSIQAEASKQVQALAERKGWSVMELADRTVPTAGLDESGVLPLDYGPRQFCARLNEAVELALFDADGKPLKSLPEPRQDDDAEKAAAAKKQLAAAKKEIKSVLTMQRDRLYEAMCTQRAWGFEDWCAYLNQHVVLRHLSQRLVWAVFREAKLAATFRPLPDGSLTDAADQPVVVNPGDRVCVAHACQLSAELAQSWQQHLRDYDVEPLFEQFGKPPLVLPEERRLESEMNDFEGHIVEAFKLRSRATRLGYVRGETQDGGFFCEYRKRLPSLGINAVVEFTGNQLPEENHQVALVALHFERVADGQKVESGSRLPLGEVPPVLLSECWNDFRLLAAEGPGFDSEWEKKTQP